MEVTWLPYELHPEVPLEGLVRDPSLSPDHVAPLDGAAGEMAREVGLSMLRRNRRINTRLALATAEYARDAGLYAPVHKALFRAHWEATARLDSIADLVEVAAAGGVDSDGLRAALAEGRYEDRLDAHRREATELGIDAIPAHIVGGRYLVLGAQPIGVFRQVLDRLRE